MQSRRALLPARAPPGRCHETAAKEEEGGRRRNAQCPEQSAGLAVEPVVEVQGVGIAAAAGATSKHESPQPARAIAGAHIDRDRALESAGHRVERIDLAGEEAEVAESGWTNLPRGEAILTTSDSD